MFMNLKQVTSKVDLLESQTVCTTNPISKLFTQSCRFRSMISESGVLKNIPNSLQFTKKHTYRSNRILYKFFYKESNYKSTSLAKQRLYFNLIHMIQAPTILLITKIALSQNIGSVVANKLDPGNRAAR